MVLLDKIEPTCTWPWSILPWWKWVDKCCERWATMAWMKEAASWFYLKRRWMKKKAVVLSHQGTKSTLCPVCVGVQRWERKGSHQPTPAWIITAVDPALDSKHLHPKKCNAPTHRDSVHNKRCILNKQTRSLTNHLHTNTHRWAVTTHTDTNR